MRSELFAYRRFHVVALFTIGALVLLGKAASIQLFNDNYVRRARSTSVNKVILHPARGLIYDRNGKLLVVNKPAYDLKVIYKQLNPEMDTTLFCKLLNIDKKQFISNISKDFRSVRYSKSVPFTFLSNLSPEQFASFQEHLFEFPGFYPELRNVRSYPHTSAAHSLGYLSEVSQEILNQKDSKYSAGDYIGVSGIERKYESILKGKKGVEYLLKNNLGKSVGQYENGKLNVNPEEGVDLISTIDLDLQAYGEELMGNKLGSIVAIEPSTGEILSMISSKSYDPNLLTINQNRGEAYSNLQNDSINKPFLDRSVMAKYPPGSIIKPILSLIALEEGITYPNRTIYCTGEYAVNSKGFTQGCHHHPTPYNIQLANAYSCNSYFYQLFRELVEVDSYSTPGVGLSIFNDYLGQFGLGNKLGVDVSHESKGFIPTPKYYDNLYKEVRSGWRSTYILSLGIGQGELQLTTVQMANLAAALANRGKWYTPHLIKGFRNNKDITNLINNKEHLIKIDKNYFEPVIDGMELVVRLGTAKNAYIPDIPICGKTGTSQNPHGKDHSVFFAFAPKENPQIAIAVFVENAGWGSDFGAPIASLMIEKYIKKEISANRKWLEDRMKKLNLTENKTDQ